MEKYSTFHSTVSETLKDLAQKPQIEQNSAENDFKGAKPKPPPKPKVLVEMSSNIKAIPPPRPEKKIRQKCQCLPLYCSKSESESGLPHFIKCNNSYLPLIPCTNELTVSHFGK